MENVSKEKQYQNIFPIKNKMLLFLSVFSLIVFVMCIYASIYMRSSEKLFVSSISINRDISNSIRGTSTVMYYATQYIETDDVEQLSNYIQFSTRLYEKISTLGAQLATEEFVEYMNIKQMIDTFLLKTDAAVNASRFGNKESSEALFIQAQRIYQLINDTGVRFSNDVIESTIEDYERAIEIQQNFRFYLALMIMLVVIYAYVFILWLSKSITDPLNLLTNFAIKISNGDFPQQDVQINTNDELVFIGEAFNRMIKDIMHLLEEERKTSLLQKELSEQQQRNLKMQNYWQEAELRALQSQLNPHFLFNTLNIITQKAILNDIGISTKLIKALSGILRYNLVGFETPVSIKEELDIVREYAYIMNARYKKISISIEADNQILDEVIPRMIIQPLVENSVIHGFDALARRMMSIKIIIQKDEQNIYIEVIDNGKGFSEALVSSHQQRGEIEPDAHKGHMSGIGLNNIKKRLQLLYSKEDVISIESIRNKYTRVMLILPMIGTGDKNV